MKRLVCQGRNSCEKQIQFWRTNKVKMPKNSRHNLTETMENSQLAHIENEIAMKNAINDVTKNGLAIRLAATKFGVSKSALHRKVLKYKTFSGESQNFNFARQHGFKSVFTIEEENLLSEYLLQASRMCYGLTLKDTQELAYRYAIANEKHIPQSWTANKMAGIEWVHLFMQTKWQELSGFIYLESDILT
ncbi:CENP-B N-terminal DNA-binding domain [Popillia japonica]|uniref:CENP-B N-terminal DNA-binding domain n=1 Tax=Popillia japonica TaxID=7064 RepID=A0AAW1MEK4_POPJA